MIKKIIEIIVIGTGAYVCGKDDQDYGTIIPSLFKYSKEYDIKVNLTFACNSLNSKINAQNQCNKISNLFGLEETKLSFIDCNGVPDLFFNQLENIDKYEACIISIPDDLHYLWAKKVLDYSIPLLIVKPLTLKYWQAIELTKIAKKNSIPAFVEFHKRYDRQLRFAKDTFYSGEIGIPLYSTTEYTQKKCIPTNTFIKWSDKTNIFSYLGVHYIDALHYVTGAMPIKVSATGQKQFLKSLGIDTFDSIQCNIEWIYKNKFTFNQTINCSWVESNKASSMSKQDFKLIGTTGRIDCEQKERGLKFLTDKKETEQINPDFCRVYSLNKFKTFEGYGIESIINFLKYLKYKELTDDRLCTFSEACISTSVIDAANLSLVKNSDWIYTDKSIDA